MNYDSDTSRSEDDVLRPNVLRVLIVEDSEDDALLLLRELKRSGYDPEWRRVETPEDMGAALREQAWDVVLADYKVPRFGAPAALRLLQDTGQDLPFIVISGKVGEDVAVEVMKAGAHDFFVKGSFKRLVSAIQREMGEAENRRRRREAEKEREAGWERESHLNAVLRSIRDVNQLIVRAKRREPLIESACASLVRTRGFSGAWIVLNDRLPAELQSAQAGFPEAAFRELVEQVGRGSLPTCGGRATAESSVVAVAEPACECGDCPLSRCYDGSAGLGVALVHGGVRFGYMGVSVPPEYANDDEEKSLLAEIAADIAFALNGMDVEAQRVKSERTIRAIFQSASDGILLVEAESGSFVLGNEAICRMLGYSAEEILKLFVADIHPAEAIEHVRAQFEKQARGEITLAEDVPVRRKDGTLFLADVNSAVFEMDGRRHMAGIFRDITERKRAEEGLKEAYDIINKSSSVAFTWKNAEGWPVEFVTENVQRLLGYTAEAFIMGEVSYADRIHVQDLPRVVEEVARMSAQEKTVEFVHEPYRVIAKDGSEKFVRDRTFIARDNNERITHYKGIVEDITKQRSLESQLAQAQKMESVGRLAGGVAHDYNNMLSVILGYTELAMDKVNPDDPLGEDLKEVLNAARRSTDITRQLLAFARRQTIDPKVIDLNEAVEGMLNMLRRLIGEDINLSWQPDRGRMPVFMDPSQFDQILANLMVNARDAIAGVGKVTLETGRVSFDEEYCADHAGFIPGEFIMLAVSDDGCGIDKETLNNIFEPFFTTKGVDKGTGLGLSTVYGIVKQNDGFINVYSEPGKGTTFRIYLPPHEGEAGLIEAQDLTETPTSRGETVLIVEDEVSILKLAQRILERLGYAVLAAATPGEAVALAEARAGEIHLLITDVVMPEMNGRELADRLCALFPDIKTLFMSGYTANAIAHRGVLEEGVNFIQKPFSTKDLGVKVRATLDQK